jgi:hypothetical protein
MANHRRLAKLARLWQVRVFAAIEIADSGGL